MKHEHKVASVSRFETSNLLTSRSLLYADRIARAPADVQSVPRGFFRHVKFTIPFALFGAALVCVAGLMTPPTYTAKAQLILDGPRSDQDFSTKKDDGASQAQAEDPKTAIETHVAVITSRYLLSRVARELWGPEKSPASPRTPTPDRTHESPSDADELAGRLALWLDALPISGLWRRDRKAQSTGGYADIERRLKVKQEGDAKIITIAFTALEPVLAASVTNRIAETYVRTRVEQEQAALRLELDRTNDRLDVLAAEASQADASARSLIRSHGALNYGVSPGAPRAANSYQRIHEALSEATAARQLQPALERRRSYLQSRLEDVKPDIRVLTLASPPDAPTSFNPFVLAAASLAPFLLLGSWLASWLGRADTRLRSCGDIPAALGIPCAGIMPKQSGVRVSSKCRKLLSDPASSFTEAIRTIMGELQREAPTELDGKNARVTLVTSSVANEGKTTLCASLAAYAALRGRKALVLDCDYWRPASTHSEQSHREPTNAENEQNLAQSPTMSDFGFDLMALHFESSEGLDAWIDKILVTRLTQLRGDYDYIFIDAPPLLSVANTRLLAALADEVLFAIRWESTTLVEARHALALMERGRCPRISAVLTRVDLKRHARYGYRDYAQYLLGYEKYARDKAKSAGRLPKPVQAAPQSR